MLKFSARHVLTACIILLTACSARPPSPSPARPASNKSLVIAHRGASGYLPEHTLEAYTLAYAQGADFIEPDVVLTRDGVPICAHDITMSAVTDVAQRFPRRARPDGRYYWIDFDLAEIKQLRKLGRRSPADTTDTRGYNVATLEETIDLVKRLNATFNKNVGIIPEPKDPAFHAENDRPIEITLQGVLQGRGYNDPDAPAIIQCFDLDALETFARLGSRIRLVYLFSDRPDDATLQRAALICHGVGPNRDLLETSDARPTPLLATLQETGFAIYPWTFTNDRQAMARFFGTPGITGLFSDYPDIAVQARNNPIPRTLPSFDRSGRR